VVRHAVPAGVDTAAVRANRVSAVDYFGEHLGRDYDVTLVQAVNAAVTPAAASATVNTELHATGKSTRRVLDLTGCTEMRLNALVIATGNAAGAAYKLSYMTTFTSAWSGTDSGLSIVVGGGTAGALRTSGWVAVPSGMQIPDCAVALLVGVAIGSTAATVGSVTLQVR
jgi:hypothetical protein